MRSSSPSRSFLRRLDSLSENTSITIASPKSTSQTSTKSLLSLPTGAALFPIPSSHRNGALPEALSRLRRMRNLQWNYISVKFFVKQKEKGHLAKRCLSRQSTHFHTCADA